MPNDKIDKNAMEDSQLEDISAGSSFYSDGRLIGHTGCFEWVCVDCGTSMMEMETNNSKRIIENRAICAHCGNMLVCENCKKFNTCKRI